MRWLILSDIHANVVALEAVIRSAGSVEGMVCLGDIVGYGPRPNESCEYLRALGAFCVAGNHDLAIANGDWIMFVGPEVREASEWTGDQLTDVNRRFLCELPPFYEHEIGILMHGTPWNAYEYMLQDEACRTFEQQQFTVGYFGHLHVCQVLIYKPSAETSSLRPKVVPGDYPLDLNQQVSAVLCNPGSVGQPRDFDPRASYAIWDQKTNTILSYRVEYDVAGVQADMSAHGLPERFA